MRHLYHSGGVPARPKRVLHDGLRSVETTELAAGEIRLIDAPLDGQFAVFVATTQFAPAHELTLRNNADGYGKHQFGTYRDGVWQFVLDPQQYPASLEFRFSMDGTEIPTVFEPIILAPNRAWAISDHDLDIPPVPDRFRHGIDHLISTPSRHQDDYRLGDRREDVVYDVIIVGSGMGGGVLADALSDLNVKVLVLEAGGLLFPTHIDNLPGRTFNMDAARRYEVGHYTNLPGSELMFGTQMNFGGRSVFWEGLIPRMDDWEMDYWPTSIRDYLRTPGSGYESAEKLLRARTSLGPFQDYVVSRLQASFPEFRVVDLPRSRHQPHDARRYHDVLQQPTGVFSTADLLLDSVASDQYQQRSFLTINLNHLVTRIDPNPDGDHRVFCQDLAGNKERIYRGRTVVLAAGSLESPRLALQSGFPDPNRKMGVGLTDHPAWVQSSTIELFEHSPYADPRQHAQIMLRHRDGAAHPYYVELLINPQYWDVRHSDDDVLDRIIAHPDDKTFVSVKFLFDSPLDDDNHISVPGPGQKLDVFVRRNLSGLQYYSEVQELRNRLMSFLHARFNPYEHLDYHSNGTVHHAGGTLRVSEDGSGVVDDQLRFLGMDRLYCCDVSVFPRIPTANPSLTLVALALRLAQELAAKVTG